MTPVGRRERLVVRRTIESAPEQIFAVLTDPTRHQDTEPTDWVRNAVDTVPITAVGQVFAMNMFIEAAGGHYVMHNLVTTFLPNRAIAWMPGSRSDTGDIGYGGWVWRYDLTPCTAGTVVTLSYDWTDTPEETRAEIGGMPSVGTSFLQESLASLDRTVLSGT
ncbi:ATPase [Rhodococcoides trifolii]|uniref:ATPase n=1 Tax=Rhodococcoides trifolii TaxID=908250 RepID=UPI00166CCD8F|nr:ATPase [Rhodococcus trifolii]